MKAQQSVQASQSEAQAAEHAESVQLDTGEATLQQSQEIVQREETGAGGAAAGVHEAAAKGTQGSGGALPHLDAIQSAFGRHDVSGVQAFTGGEATAASEAMGANGFAVTGDGPAKVAFSGDPSLHTAAHEAAHAVVGNAGGVSLDGGVGKAGDAYEQHADAVADLVVQGKSAEGLLDEAVGGGGGGGAVQHQPAVQHQAASVQLDIKSDLRESMGGWGTDEEGIYDRLSRASGKELTAVANDAALMSELQGELSRGEMIQVLRMLPVSVERKLNMAMSGWGADEAFIHETLASASEQELARIANNPTMVERLQGELSRDHMLRVLDRLPMSVERKLGMAMSGWGADEAYILRTLQSATTEEKARVAQNGLLVSQLQGEVSHENMKQIFSTLNMPVERKLGLAMDGWGTDEAYIKDVLDGATQPELARVAGNDTLVNRLEDELSGEDQRSILDRLNLPLSRKLELAMRGWGTDEIYIATSITNAPEAEVVSVAQNDALIRRVYDELNFRRFDTGPQQRLANAIIINNNNVDLVRTAFEAYWDIDTKTENASNADSSGNAQPRTAVWGVEILRRTHDHLKDLPPQDARNSVFSTLTLLADSGGATMNAAGNFRLGEEAMAWRTDGLAQAASAGDTEIFLHDVSAFAVNSNITVGPEPSPDVHLITAVDAGTNKLTLATALTKGYPQGVIVSDGSTNQTARMGVGTDLTAAAAAGQKDIIVKDVDVFDAGDTVAIGRGGSREVHTIQTKDAANNKYTLQNNLANPQNNRSPVTRNDDAGFRRVNWLEAVIRHEIAHSVDTAVGGVTGFTQGLGGWWTGTSFDDWATAMGNPWQTNDGSTISDAEKRAIKDHIESERSGDGGHALNNGLDATHAINKYWNKGVPVIEATKPCVQGGKQYWTSPQNLQGFGGNYFALNHYYHKYQYYNDSVQTNRVRDYSIFSPAEFFAEVYTVYYEEAGDPSATMGSKVPVASWRDWITNNIHNRGMDPGGASESGHVSGGTGMKSGDSGE